MAQMCVYGTDKYYDFPWKELVDSLQWWEGSKDIFTAGAAALLRYFSQECWPLRKRRHRPGQWSDWSDIVNIIRNPQSTVMNNKRTSHKTMKNDELITNHDTFQLYSNRKMLNACFFFQSVRLTYDEILIKSVFFRNWQSACGKMMYFD